MSCLNDTIDFSAYLYPGEPQLLRTLETVDCVKIVFITVVMAGALLGNVSVIVVVALNKSMHTTINIYVVNLAVADLLVCGICMTSFLSETLQTDHVYLLGPIMCKIESFSRMTFLTSSVMTLSAIACDRYTAILFPLRSRITKQRTKLVISAVWLISIAVSAPLLFVRKHYTAIFLNFIQPTCGEWWPMTWDEEERICIKLLWLPQLYYTFLSITLFFLPVAIMTVTYSLILRRLSVSVPGETVEANHNVQDRSRKKVIRMVFTVLLAFIFCWMPLQLVLLYDQYRNKEIHSALPWWYNEAGRVSEFLAYSNSFLNPIIYGGFNKSFRDNLCLLLRCRRRRRFGTPDMIQRFRLTLTTALSTTGKRTSVTHDRKESKTAPEKIAVFTPNIRTAPQRCAGENGVVQEAHKEEDSTPV